MNRTLGKILFLLFFIISIPASLYPFYESGIALSEFNRGAKAIEFDSGVFYMCLVSIFWPAALIHFCGMQYLRDQKGKSNKISQWIYVNATKISISWFIASLILANIAPFLILRKFENAGYIKCDDPREVSRISRGRSLILVKGNCDAIGN